jgi:hypothetical protein
MPRDGAGDSLLSARTGAHRSKGSSVSSSVQEGWDATKHGKNCRMTGNSEIEPQRAKRARSRHLGSRSPPAHQQSAAQRSENFECGRADLAHYSHRNRNTRGSDLRKAERVRVHRVGPAVFSNWRKIGAVRTSHNPVLDSFRFPDHQEVIQSFSDDFQAKAEGLLRE